MGLSLIPRLSGIAFFFLVCAVDFIRLLILWPFLEGLDHCTTAPVGTHKSLFFESHEIPFSRSMIEKRENPRPEINLDRLSELEKVNVITLPACLKPTRKNWYTDRYNSASKHVHACATGSAKFLTPLRNLPAA